MPTLTPPIIAAAIKGFEAQKLEIDSQIAALRALLKPASPASTESKTRKKRTISLAGRKRMKAAQQKRWAAYNAAHPKKGKAAAATA